MDLSAPISSVIPSGHGAVLAVLARTQKPLSGRQVAELADGLISRSRVSEVLRDLVVAGVVLSEDHPPAKAYVLNRDHVAAGAIVALAHLRTEVLERMRSHIASWSVAPARVALFGSFARGDGGLDSDIDVLVVRRGNVGEANPQWIAQLIDLERAVRGWTGNPCAILEYSTAELQELADAGDPIVSSIQAEGLELSGRSLPRAERQAIAR